MKKLKMLTVGGHPSGSFVFIDPDIATEAKELIREDNKKVDIVEVTLLETFDEFIETYTDNQKKELKGKQSAYDNIMGKAEKHKATLEKLKGKKKK